MTSLLATYNTLKILEIAPALQNICRYFTSRSLQGVATEMAALPAANVNTAFDLRADHVAVAITASGRYAKSSFYRQLVDGTLELISGYDIAFHGAIPATVTILREAKAFTLVVKHIVIESAGARLIEHTSQVPAKAAVQPPTPPPAASSTWNIALRLGPPILLNQQLRIDSVQWNVATGWGKPAVTITGSLLGEQFVGQATFDGAPAGGTILVTPSFTYTVAGVIDGITYRQQSSKSKPQPASNVARHQGAASTTAVWLAKYSHTVDTHPHADIGNIVVDALFQGASP